MKKNNTGGNQETTAEARLKAFRERCKAKGLHGGGKPYLSIDMDGGFVEGTYQGTTERKSVKFKNMRKVHRVIVTDGWGRTADGEGKIKPGEYELTCGGALDSRLAGSDKCDGLKSGATFGAFFKGKRSVPGIKQPVKQYEFYGEDDKE